MQTIEFSTEITEGNHIEVPPVYARLFEKQKHVQVVLFLENETDETDINGTSILPLLAKSSSFDFLKSEDEDIYTDADLRVKY